MRAKHVRVSQFEPRRTGNFPIFSEGLTSVARKPSVFVKLFSKGWSEADYAVRYITGPFIYFIYFIIIYLNLCENYYHSITILLYSYYNPKN